ncbi:hypothetical protein [Parafrankia discariae]|uniref:hypothetical protein n=1 Tax=Parafrankia discariae TaxID=365528 RepID=UPI00035D6EA6|nr:hypothetical protein [Parafrankia discariae]
MQDTDVLVAVPADIVRPSRSRQLTVMAFVAVLLLAQLFRTEFRSDRNDTGEWIFYGAMAAGALAGYGWFFWRQRKMSYVAVDNGVLIRSDWRGRTVRVPLSDLRQATFARIRSSRFSSRTDARLVIERDQAPPLTMWMLGWDQKALERLLRSADVQVRRPAEPVLTSALPETFPGIRLSFLERRPVITSILVVLAVLLLIAALIGVEALVG